MTWSLRQGGTRHRGTAQKHKARMFPADGTGLETPRSHWPNQTFCSPSLRATARQGPGSSRSLQSPAPIGSPVRHPPAPLALSKQDGRVPLGRGCPPDLDLGFSPTAVRAVGSRPFCGGVVVHRSVSGSRRGGRCGCARMDPDWRGRGEINECDALHVRENSLESRSSHSPLQPQVIQSLD